MKPSLRPRLQRTPRDLCVGTRDCPRLHRSSTCRTSHTVRVNVESHNSFLVSKVLAKVMIVSLWSIIKCCVLEIAAKKAEETRENVTSSVSITTTIMLINIAHTITATVPTTSFNHLLIGQKQYYYYSLEQIIAVDKRHGSRLSNHSDFAWGCGPFHWRGRSIRRLCGTHVFSRLPWLWKHLSGEKCWPKVPLCRQEITDVVES